MPLNPLAKQCHAKAKSTGQKCRNPCAFSMPVCRLHGAKKRSVVRAGPANGRYLHGQKTNEAKIATHEEGKIVKELKASLKKARFIK